MTPTISVDTTPVLSPTPTMESSPAEAGGADSIVGDMAGGEDRGKMVIIFYLLQCSDLTTEDATDDTSPTVPAYITAAAEHISCALRHEAEDDIEQSLAAYRAAIGGVLWSPSR